MAGRERSWWRKLMVAGRLKPANTGVTSRVRLSSKAVWCDRPGIDTDVFIPAICLVLAPAAADPSSADRRVAMRLRESHASASHPREVFTGRLLRAPCP